MAGSEVSELTLSVQHSQRGTYCVACGSRCRRPTDRKPRKRRAICKGYESYGFTREDMRLLNDRFREWKLEHHNGSGMLADNPRFADALRALMVDNGYGQSDVSIMLGVSRERVRQWANHIGIERGRSGSDMRIWDPEALRFRNVGHMPEYRRAIKDLAPARRSRAEICRAIARWVLIDLQEDLGRTPAHMDLADALGMHPGILNGWLGHTTYHGPITDQNRALWGSAGMTYGNYALGGRGRPNRRHSPIKGFPLPAGQREARYKRAREVMDQLTAELGHQPRHIDLCRALGVREGYGVPRWLTGRHITWRRTVEAIYGYDAAATGRGGSQAPTE